MKVVAAHAQLDVECDENFATFEEGKCTLTLWWGSDALVDVSVHTFTHSNMRIQGKLNTNCFYWKLSLCILKQAKC